MNIILKQHPNLLCVIHLNIQSLPRHIDELREDLHSKVPYVVMMSETWLKSWHTTNMMRVEGYKLYRNDRDDSRRGGGVGILVKSQLKVSRIFESDEDPLKCQFIILEVQHNGRKLLLGCVYRPPSQTTICNFIDTISSISAEFNDIIIGGDLNLNLLVNNNMITEYKTSLSSCGLTLVNMLNPTHFQGSSSLIDHFMVANSDSVKQYQQLNASGYSSHDLLLLLYDFPLNPEIEQIKYRDFKAIDIAALEEDLIQTDWSWFLMLQLHDCVEKFHHKIEELYNSHVPLRVSRLRNTSQPWMTSEISGLMRQRNKAYKLWKNSRQNKSGNL